MSKLLRLETYDDPEDMAAQGCQWHEANDGPPATHHDALLACGMRDPLQISAAINIMRNLTAENGEFHHLTVAKKYVETSAKVAEAREVPRGRSVVKMAERKIKAVDDAREKIAAHKYLPPEIVRQLDGLSNAIVSGAARQQNAERTYDLIEWQKEIAAKLNLLIMEMMKDGEKRAAEVTQLRDEVKFLRDIVRRGGATGVPVPA